MDRRLCRSATTAATVVTADAGGRRHPAADQDQGCKPVYPREAQSKRVQGVVIVEATIDPAGKVSETKVLRSIPLLDAAAVDAVKQWEFTPTVFNGMPTQTIGNMRGRPTFAEAPLSAPRPLPQRPPAGHGQIVGANRVGPVAAKGRLAGGDWKRGALGRSEDSDQACDHG